MGLFKYYPSNPKKLNPEMEKRIFFHSLIFPALMVFIFWIVEITEQTIGISFVRFGVYPLHLKGLPGILFSPFIHSGFSHLISNSIPFFILMFALIYFYRRISYRIFIQLFFLSGAFVWLSGREAWHIGASGVIYAMAAFHFVSGIIRNDTRLLTLSVTVVFLYGGMVWGLLPIKPDVSWEGHLWGAISGVVLALYYRKYLIRRDKFDWEEEDDDEEEEGEGNEEGKDRGEGIVDDQKFEDESVGERQLNSNSTENKKNENKWPDNMSHT
jgi:membrane associated rhomboid family serine protease